MSSRFRILGRTRLRIGDRLDEQWAHAKPRGILAVLLLHSGRAWPVDRLRDWVWPDGAGPETSGTFYTYSRRIREALDRMPGKPDLIRKNGTLRVDVDRAEIDYFEFRDTYDRARAMLADGEHGPARDAIAAALELWDDPALADAQGQSAHQWRRWAQTELLVPAQDLLLKALAGLGRFEDVLRHFADLPMEQKTNLTLIKRQIEAFFGVGREEEAAAVGLSTRKKLKADGSFDEADDLLRFYNDLERRSRGHRSGAVAPPAPPASSAPRLLPHDLSDFAGRADHLQRLDAMATTTTGELVRGVAVIDGPAGVGKSTLAVHWAHRVAHRFPGGQLYVDLGGYSGGSRVESPAVVDRFLAALGFPVEQIPHAPGRAAKLRQLLSRRQTLVILENAYNSGHVLPMLDYLSDCLVVITSRRRLTKIGWRGAASIPVEPLTYQDAKVWFTERVGTRATSDPGAASVLAALCGGIPLALHWVADHVRARPQVRLAEFVDELRDSSALLGLGDDGDGPDDSIRTVFSWSYQALPPDEQRLFRLLGLHPGPDISLDVAAALAGRDKQTTKRGLDALVNIHLMGQPETRSRYRFHDLLRRFADECGSAAEHRDERLAAEDRLLGFYLHTAHNADRIVFPYQLSVTMLPLPDGVVPLEFADDESAMAWCLRERANLGAVVNFAGARGRHEYASRLPDAAGEILQRFGYYDDVLSALDVALNSARLADDLEAEGDVLANLGFVRLKLGDLDAAESHLRAADEISRRLDDPVGSAISVHHLAIVQASRGQFGKAITMHHDALDMLRKAAATGQVILALCGLSETCRRAGSLDAAMRHCRDGLWLAEQLGDQRGLARCLTELSLVYHEQGDLTAAKGYCTRSIALNDRLKDPAQSAKAYNLLATIQLGDGDYAAAEDLSRKALTFSRAARDAKETATGWDTFGQALYAQARRDDAAEAFGKALAIFENLGDPLAGSVRARLSELPTSPPAVPAGRTEPMGNAINLPQTTPRLA